MRDREVKVEVWSYSEGDGFPNHRPSFFRRHAKAIMIVFAAIFLAAMLLTSIAADRTDQPTFTEDSPYVYDGAHVLDSSVADTLTELNEKLVAQAKGAQLYIVTVDSLPLGQTIEDYSIEQAQRIGAGDSKKDNGVLYTFVKSTRQDRLEVGYGLEDRLTDSVCAKILDQAHARYRNGSIKDGVKDLAQDVANIIQPGTGSDSYFIDSYLNESDRDEKQPDLVTSVLVWTFFIGITVLAVVIPNPRSSNYVGGSSSRTRRSHGSSPHRSSHRSGGGHFGGGGASGSW